MGSRRERARREVGGQQHGSPWLHVRNAELPGRGGGTAAVYARPGAGATTRLNQYTLTFRFVAVASFTLAAIPAKVSPPTLRLA
jgi:hypothetical protein